MSELPSALFAAAVFLAPLAILAGIDRARAWWLAERPHRARLRHRLDQIDTDRRRALIEHRRNQINRNQQKGQNQ